MAAHLVIVESPGKTKKINEILGAGYRVRASFGHVRDLPSRAPAASGGRGRTGDARGGGGEVPLGLDIAGGWKPTWEVLASKAGVVAKLKAAAAGAESVYLATDLDREGEAIAWHLADLLGGRSDRFRRVSFSEITPAAVRAAFAEPRRLDVALVRAQLARRFLDRVVGWQLSPLLGRRVQYGLSAGRVQTAALNLLVERDEQIRTFVAAPFWTVEVSLTLEAGADPVVAQLVDDAVKVVRFEERAELDEALVLARSAPLRLEGVDRQAATQNPRAPFTTSTLQQAASSRLKLSVSDTMASAQRLYEAGHITYMRSDAVALAPEAKAAARAWLVAAFGESAVPAKPPTYEAKAGAQEAHEAIRPTDPARSPTALGNVEDVDRHLYDLVRRRMLASQMAPARFERVTWRLVSEAQGGLRFAARGRSVVDPGFHRVLPPESLADEPPAVPDVAVGRLWDPARGGDAVVEAVESHTKPPPRFTEASLVAELERQGVGRAVDLRADDQDAHRPRVRVAGSAGVHRDTARPAARRPGRAVFRGVVRRRVHGEGRGGSRRNRRRGAGSPCVPGRVLRGVSRGARARRGGGRLLPSGAVAASRAHVPEVPAGTAAVVLPRGDDGRLPGVPARGAVAWSRVGAEARVPQGAAAGVGDGCRCRAVGGGPADAVAVSGVQWGARPVEGPGRRLPAPVPGLAALQRRGLRGRARRGAGRRSRSRRSPLTGGQSNSDAWSFRGASFRMPPTRYCQVEADGRHRAGPDADSGARTPAGRVPGRRRATRHRRWCEQLAVELFELLDGVGDREQSA